MFVCLSSSRTQLWPRLDFLSCCTVQISLCMHASTKAMLLKHLARNLKIIKKKIDFFARKYGKKLIVGTKNFQSIRMNKLTSVLSTSFFCPIFGQCICVFSSNLSKKSIYSSISPVLTFQLIFFVIKFLVF